MNLLLLKPEDIIDNKAYLTDPKRLAHIQTTLKLNLGDSLKIGVENGLKGTGILTEITPTQMVFSALKLDQLPPKKIPVTLIVALPRPKVVRRLVKDAVTLGVEKLILIHSYHVDKSYWQSPLLKNLDEEIRLGLEQAGDTVLPVFERYQRFKPFVEDVLPVIIGSESSQKQAFVAHPYSTQRVPTGLVEPCVLVIGAENGFIPYEIDLLEKNGCVGVSLGERILRTETAISTLIGRMCTSSF